jgi:hypothetical protein
MAASSSEFGDNTEARKCFLSKVSTYETQRSLKEDPQSLVNMLDRATQMLDPDVNLYYAANTMIVNHPLSKESFEVKTRAVDLYLMKALDYASTSTVFSGRNGCKAREIKAIHMYRLLTLIWNFLQADKSTPSQAGF